MDRSILSSIILVIIFSIKLYCAALLFFVILFHVVWSFVNLSYLLPWAVTYAALTGLTFLESESILSMCLLSLIARDSPIEGWVLTLLTGCA